MAVPVSALELNPEDTIREVTQAGLEYYVKDLSRLCLPDDFSKEHADNFDVKLWKPTDRLHGKFGRFVIMNSVDVDTASPGDSVVVMGTTIGLKSVDRYGSMFSLRHYDFPDVARKVARQRGLIHNGTDRTLVAVDYGTTRINLDENGRVKSFSVGGASLDYGRASAEGRQVTCDTIARLLSSEIEVINADPEPRESQQIIMVRTAS